MADKLVVILANTDPADASGVGTPFLQATVAAGLDYEVELIFTGRAGRLAVNGVAQKLPVGQGAEITVYDLIKHACAAGVRFKVCTSVLEQWGRDILPEIEETVATTYIVNQAMDDNTVTLTY